jgi:hypothetical protein
MLYDDAILILVTVMRISTELPATTGKKEFNVISKKC